MKHFSFRHHPFSSHPFLTFLYIYTCCSVIFLALDMHRNHRNRGGRQGQRPTRHARNNPVYDDLFASSRALSKTSSDSLPAMATPRRGELIEAPLPAEIVRRRLSDYARSIVQRHTMRVNAPLQRGVNFKID